MQKNGVAVRFGIYRRLAPACAADRSAPVILGLAILAAFVVAWLPAQNPAAPIQELTSIADQTSRGALDRVPMRSLGECPMLRAAC